MTALQAATVGGYPGPKHNGAKRPIEDFGATCWYFAQRLTDELEAAGKAVVPIGAHNCTPPLYCTPLLYYCTVLCSILFCRMVVLLYCTGGLPAPSSTYIL
jgi:hypothetical protein